MVLGSLVPPFGVLHHAGLGAHHVLCTRCAKSQLFLAQAEAHFPHSDPPLFTICNCGERQREVCEKEFRTAHLNLWDKEKPQYPVFQSFELIMHASVGGWFSGLCPGYALQQLALCENAPFVLLTACCIAMCRITFARPQSCQ